MVVAEASTVLISVCSTPTTRRNANHYMSSSHVFARHIPRAARPGPSFGFYYPRISFVKRCAFKGHFLVAHCMSVDCMEMENIVQGRSSFFSL